MHNQTIKNTRVALAGTAYTVVVAVDSAVDRLVSVASFYNGSGGAISPLLAIHTGVPGDDTYVVHAYGSVANGASAQLPAGLQFLIPAGYALYVKGAATTTLTVQTREVAKGEKI